ncbi:MAG: hypothetical protein QJR02_11380 [Sinobacteraceae bacterium]|nr:hypothetical protein [Nevskiaceae bacterium]
MTYAARATAGQPLILPATIGGESFRLLLELRFIPLGFKDPNRPEQACRFQLAVRREFGTAWLPLQEGVESPELVGYVSRDGRTATIQQWYRRCVDKGSGFGRASLAMLVDQLPALEAIRFEWVLSARSIRLYESFFPRPGQELVPAPALDRDAFVCALRENGFRRITIRRKADAGRMFVATVTGERSKAPSFDWVDESRVLLE